MDVCIEYRIWEEGKKHTHTETQKQNKIQNGFESDQMRIVPAARFISVHVAVVN